MCKQGCLVKAGVFHANRAETGEADGLCGSCQSPPGFGPGLVGASSEMSGAGQARNHTVPARLLASRDPEFRAF